MFDEASDAYRELDGIAPLNMYAKSKAEGEAALRDMLPDRHLILRTAWLYEPGPARIEHISLVRKVCARFGLNADLLVPKMTRELGQAVPRPLKVLLDCRTIREAGVGVVRSVDDGLAALYQWHSAGAAAVVK